MTKDQVLEFLWNHREDYISGAALAAELGLSRTAIWKAVEALRSDGYTIDSLPNRGYLLVDAGNRLDAFSIKSHLRHQELDIRTYETISSTNTVLKQLAEEGAPEGLALVAEGQTAGRGRMGRSFYSPEKTGLYMSLLLRPRLSAYDATVLTVAAAVAVAESIEELTSQKTQIKWVNDVLIDGKKICGILTEGAIDVETGMLQYAIVGIGINIRPPKGGFPEEIASLAGALLPENSGLAQSGNTDQIPAEKRSEDSPLRSRLAARVLDRLMDFYEALPERSFYTAYKSRSFLLGRPINILAVGEEPRPATAIDIAPDFSLIVQTEDGKTEHLNSGEVSVRERR